MRRYFRDASKLEHDARAEHAFFHSLIAQLQAELQDARHAESMARAELERARRRPELSSSPASPDAASCERATTTETTTIDRPEDAVGTRGGETTRAREEDASTSPSVDADDHRRTLEDALARADEERARMIEELEEMRGHMRTATASAHRANAEVNAVAHQNRALMEKERRRAEAAEARVRELMEAASSVREAEAVDDERDDEKVACAEAAAAAAREESRRLREEKDALETRVAEMTARMDAMENEDVDEDAAVAALVEERERALLGRAYADGAVVNLRRTALEARATCASYRARLYPDGEPRDDIVRTLVVAHAVLEGHPFDSASRDVTRAIRARLDASEGRRLVILVSENLSDIVPDDPHAESLDTALKLKENARSNATLRLTYAFDLKDVDTGEISRGEERTAVVSVGAAGTPHAFAMQSVWLESGITGIEDVLKAAYSRLRDAESTASAAKIRAIALLGEASRAKRRAGSSARSEALDRRENALNRRESALASEVVALESTVARAREESEAIRRDAARVVADAESRLAVAEDEIRRLRSVQSAVGRANDRSKTWRRGDVTAEVTESRSRDAMSALAAAEARLARITAARVAKSGAARDHDAVVVRDATNLPKSRA
jgi:hypothetical protein